MAAPTPMSAPATLSGLRSELKVPGLRQVFFNSAKSVNTLIPTLFKVQTSKRSFEETLSMTGITDFVALAEGSTISAQAIGQGYKSRWTHVRYANGTSYTQDAIDDELYGVLKDKAETLGKSSARTREKQAASFFNGGQTTVWNTEEGQFFFDTDHPIDPRALTIGSASTFSNLVTGDLAISTLQEAIVLLQTCPDAMGSPMNLSPRMLLVHPTKVFLAKQILGSPGEHDSANRASNPFADFNIKVVSWPYLTSTSACFLGSDENPLIWFNRTPLKDDLDYDISSLIYKHVAHYRVSFGAKDPRGWVCITGS